MIEINDRINNGKKIDTIIGNFPLFAREPKMKFI
tara:strand:+ start:496 stop:597 length:102 start_codon:yes stop_codon:yes gene_type:complete